MTAPSDERLTAIRSSIESMHEKLATLDPKHPALSALSLAELAFKTASFDPSALIDTAQRLEEEGRFDLAAEFYREVVKVEPHRPRGWTNLGEVRRKLSQWDLALDAYNHALERDGKYVPALAGKAEALRMVGRLRESLAPFKAVLEQSPDHIFAVQGLAAALSELGQPREALPHWEHALRLRPESGFASDGLARCHEALAEQAGPH
ncbi:MAG: tetratricopeptide repeat protein [Myxococcota bacterium]